MEPARQTRFTEDEYLALEAASRTKHEFVRGEIRAMAGASPEHNLIAGNVASLLRAALRGRPCGVFPSDQRVYVGASGRYTYPDVTVVCGRVDRAPQDPMAITNPSLLVEVLSPSTEHYDLGEKLADYRRIDSLHEVVTVRVDARHVELWQRTDVGRWQWSEFDGAGTVLELSSLGVRLPLDEVYEQMAWLKGE